MPTVQECAIPFGICLVSFLAYPSQVLFHYIEPYPLTVGQSVRFNVLVAVIFVSFLRAAWTDPGRVPAHWAPSGEYNDDTDVVEDDAWRQRQRWCRKCEAFKPPRAHHCKTCQRYEAHVMVVVSYFDGELISVVDVYRKWTTIAYG